MLIAVVCAVSIVITIIVISIIVALVFIVISLGNAGMTPMADPPGARSASGAPCSSRSTTRMTRRPKKPWVSPALA